VELWSIGHSTHPLDRLVELLALHEVRLPGRRADGSTLAPAPARGNGGAGGLAAGPRHRLPAPPRLGGWRLAERRLAQRVLPGVRRHALTAEFAAGLAELGELATQRRTAVMCSEAVWWRCHRRLIADRAAPHVLAAFAEVQPDGTVRYPPA
jgi:hypothetical protein